MLRGAACCALPIKYSDERIYDVLVVSDESNEDGGEEKGEVVIPTRMRVT